MQTRIELTCMKRVSFRRDQIPLKDKALSFLPSKSVYKVASLNSMRVIEKEQMQILIAFTCMNGVPFAERPNRAERRRKRSLIIFYRINLFTHTQLLLVYRLKGNRC